MTRKEGIQLKWYWIDQGLIRQAIKLAHSVSRNMPSLTLKRHTEQLTAIRTGLRVAFASG
jgi:hypothetical protein